MKERQEWELINNNRFGREQHRAVDATHDSPRTADAGRFPTSSCRACGRNRAFPRPPGGHRCVRASVPSRGVPPPTVSVFGSQFLTWRRVPLVPSDKCAIDRDGQVPTTRIFLVRAGQERRGVVALHQPSIGDERLPSFAIRFNGIDEKGIASYLVTAYFSLAILAEDAAGSLDGVEIGNYRDYGN
jgi:hypothetical protein